MKRIYIPDIECDSCVKVVTRRLQKMEGVDRFDVGFDHVDVEGSAKETDIIKAVKQAGFRASTTPFERKTFRERWRDWRENPEKYAMERRMLLYAVGIFAILTLLEALAWAGFLHETGARYLPWFLYLNLSVSALGAVIWHFYSYRTTVTCMVGMMIGMTVGMQTGMMVGAILGATNGFFIGALVGMLLATAVGALTGQCCGVMGLMEGMMAGVMGGTMGPMISVMMLSDNIELFMPFYIAINLVIAAGMAYMYFEESIEHKQVERREYDFVTFSGLCVVVTAALVALMVYGPKAAIVG